MKKFTLLFVIAFIKIGITLGQVAIPGEIFARTPGRFNGRKVTLENVEIVQSVHNHNQIISRPIRCTPPKGYSKTDIKFIGAPDFKACFFMLDAMKEALDRESGNQNIRVQITFRGDNRAGYHITLCRINI